MAGGGVGDDGLAGLFRGMAYEEPWAVPAAPPVRNPSAEALKENWPAMFLEAFRACQSVRMAAHAAGVARSCVYDRRESDPAFAERFARAERDVADALRDRVRELALNGQRELVLHQGKPVFVWHDPATGEPVPEEQADPARHERRPVWRYTRSDALLVLALKTYCPEYREAGKGDAGDGEKPWCKEYPVGPGEKSVAEEV